MNMIDINDLGLNEPDPIAWDKYEESGAGKPLPPKGEYLFEAPKEFTKENFKKGNKGQLIVLTDPLTIAEGPNAGYAVRFNRVSTTKYSNREGSPAGDYFKAFGITAKPTTNQEYAQVIAATAGKRFRAAGDWEAFDKDTGFSKKGMENFPKRADGTYQPWIDHPTAKEADPQKPGEMRPKRVWANFRITRYIAKK